MSAFVLLLLKIGAVAVGVFAGGCAVYVIASFALLWRAVPAPPFGSRLRIMSRELILAALVQPALPLFYFIGRRMGGGDGQPIVLVHGYFQNRVDFVGIARRFRARGLGPLYGFNYPWTAGTSDNVKRLAHFVEQVKRETGKATVDLLAHSMGGLVCLEYIADAAGSASVRRCVTIATPHAGVLWTGPILGAASREIRATSPFLLERKARAVGVPCLSIYSAADNVVFPVATSALAPRGGTDLESAPLGHLSILFDRAVIDEAGAFLERSEAKAVSETVVVASAGEGAPEGRGAADASVEGLAEEVEGPGEDEAGPRAGEGRVDELARQES